MEKKNKNRVMGKMAAALLALVLVLGLMPAQAAYAGEDPFSAPTPNDGSTFFTSVGETVLIPFRYYALGLWDCSLDTPSSDKVTASFLGSSYDYESGYASNTLAVTISELGDYSVTLRAQTVGLDDVTRTYYIHVAPGLSETEIVTPDNIVIGQEFTVAFNYTFSSTPSDEEKIKYRLTVGWNGISVVQSIGMPSDLVWNENVATVTYPCKAVGAGTCTFQLFLSNVEIEKKTITVKGPSYTIKFVNWDGTVLQSGEIEQSETPAYTGETPVKEPTEEGHYSFVGWTPEIAEVSENATYTAAYAKEAHTFSNYKTITEATCTEAGEKEAMCDNCSYVTQEEIPAGHTEVTDSAVPATCTESGKTEGKHCSVCGEVLAAQKSVEALGHDWNDWQVTTEPAIGKAGEKQRTCSRCGEKETEAIPALIGYTVTAGAGGSWTKGSSEGFTITVKRSEDDASCFSHYIETLIDGNIADVSAKSGSTIVTISAETLEKLGTGTHTITVKFDDGDPAEATFAIADKPAEQKEQQKNNSTPKNSDSPKAPQTGDNNQSGLWAVLLGASVLAVILLIFADRKYLMKRR